jgi:hypothetical protein
MGALPAQYSNVLATQGLGALTGGLNLGQAQFQLPQTVMNDLQSYLQLGQAASQIGGGLGAIGQQSQEGMLSSIGSLGALGSSALFGSPGLGLGGGTGLLGSGTPGLLTSALGGGTPGLGGLFSGAGLLGAQGPLLGTAADASIASGGPPLALAAKAAAA